MIISEYKKKLEGYLGCTAIPADFRDFWSNKMNEIPKAVTIQTVPFVNSVAVYETLILSMENYSIRARVIRPARTGRHPLVLMFHDLNRDIRGWHHMTRFIAQGYGVIALESPVNKINWLQNPKAINFESYIRDALLLGQFARQLSWVNEQKIVTWGEGLGGGLAIAVASMLPCAPWCCALNPLPADIDTLGYCDIAAFSNGVIGEVLMGICLMDTIAPPEAQYAIYNRLNCSKTLKVYPKHMHERVNAFENEFLTFLNKYY